MIPLLLGSVAFAVTPPRPTQPVTAEAILCARPVTFTKPYPWHYAKDAPPLTSGTVLLIQGDADLLRPRNIGQRMLFVAGNPVEVLARAGGTALVLTSEALPDAPTRVWFDIDTLPERVDGPLLSILGVGALLIEPLEITAWGSALTVGGRNELLAATKGWTKGCDGTAVR